MTKLSSSESGLSSIEAGGRLKKYGFNEFPREKPKGALFYLGRQINQPLIYVLIAATIITAYLEEWIDTIVIAAVIVVNVLIGFTQERKAGQAVQELTKYEVPTAEVLRDGDEVALNSRELVPGDIVILHAGNMIPADLRLIESVDLYADESLLTGESEPDLKHIEPITGGNPIPADQENMVFSGTYIVRGRGKGIVVGTGKNTEISKISIDLTETKDESYPLIKKISSLGKTISVLIIVSSAALFLIGIMRGYETIYMFRAAVALAVASIPEGLPALFTMGMAFGVRSMARKNAIVRSLPAVEALGSTTVICTDKTGTLTMNRMKVVEIFAGNRTFNSEAPRYECVQHCDYPGPISIGREPDLGELMKAVQLCNDAEITEDARSGDPMELALLEAADKLGLTSELPRIDEVPFSSELGYMATLNQGSESNHIFLKGAPEAVLGKCSRIQIEGKSDRVDPVGIQSELEKMASRGLRVLGVAKKTVPNDKLEISETDLAEMTFLGLVGMRDPPRPEVREAISSCARAGIRVIMITGDHRETASAIAEEIGISSSDARVATGEDIEAADEQEFQDMLEEVTIFARTTPQHKLRIVKGLRRRGEVVAATGDGINDTPALKAADIGVAMGLGGTDVAKAAADIVIKDDNFATIVSAVEEGRDVYSKLQRIFAWIIPTSINESIIVFSAIALGVVLPLLPLQILWANMVSAIALAIPLVREPKEKGLLRRPPRSPEEPLVTNVILRKFVISSIVMIVGTFGIFFLYLESGFDEDISRTIALNTLIFFEIFYLISSRSFTETAFNRGLLSNRWMLIGILLCLLLQMSVTYVPVLQTMFETASISLSAWLASAAVASAVLIAVELEKFLVKMKGN